MAGPTKCVTHGGSCEDSRQGQSMTSHREPTSQHSPSFRTAGVFETQAAARAAITAQPAHIAVVVRGTPRSVLFQCPCGCGEILSINVDRDAGRAWRLLRQGDTVSLLPSVWRTSGCMSHFILWRNDVWWCSNERDDNWLEDADVDAIERWLSSLRKWR